MCSPYAGGLGCVSRGARCCAPTYPVATKPLPITLVRAPTFFVIETQYTPKRSGADHIPDSGRTIHCLKVIDSASEPASSRGSRVQKLKNEILCRIGARACHIQYFESHYRLKAYQRVAKAPLHLPKEKAPPPLYDTAKTYRGGELKTAAYAIQPTVDQSVLLKRNAP